MMTDQMLGPLSATRAIASRMDGTDITASVMRMTTPSSTRKNPETRPMHSPAAMEMTAAATPTSSETWPPAITRENTSRPSASVPSQ